MADPKTALITGAAGGVGRATVDVFLEAGWQVIAVDIQDQPALPAAATYYKVDLASEEQIANLAAEVKLPSGLDALVNNAALQITKPLVDTSADEWDRVHAINLRAPFLLARYFYAALKQARGAVVNVSSVHAMATSAEIGAYASSKGGLLAVTRTMAIEFAADGIRVNALLPGAVDTEMLAAGLSRGGKDPAAQKQALAAKTLLKRIGDPQEIARAIYFLADSSQSGFITGQSLVADGGALTRLSTE